jgi:hypothetical protein
LNLPSPRPARPPIPPVLVELLRERAREHRLVEIRLVLAPKPPSAPIVGLVALSSSSRISWRGTRPCASATVAMPQRRTWHARGRRRARQRAHRCRAQRHANAGGVAASGRGRWSVRRLTTTPDSKARLVRTNPPAPRRSTRRVRPDRHRTGCPIFTYGRRCSATSRRTWRTATSSLSAAMRDVAQIGAACWCDGMGVPCGGSACPATHLTPTSNAAAGVGRATCTTACMPTLALIDHRAPCAPAPSHRSPVGPSADQEQVPDNTQIITGGEVHVPRGLERAGSYA